jgi:hypothetical protein
MARKKPTKEVSDHEAISRVVNILSATVLRRWATDPTEWFKGYRDDVATALRVLSFELGELEASEKTEEVEEVGVELGVPPPVGPPPPVGEEGIAYEPIPWEDLISPLVAVAPEPPVREGWTPTPETPEPPIREVREPAGRAIGREIEELEDAMSEGGAEETASALAEAEVSQMMKKYGLG